MTDPEIKKYIKEHNYKIRSYDAVSDIFVTSPQIIDEIYDFTNHIMTIITPDNTFTFEWLLEDQIERN